MTRNTLLKSTLIGICSLLIISMVSHSDSRVIQKQITVVLRYDDYSADSATELEIKILDALQKKGASCTFAVIPYDMGRLWLTQRKADTLKKSLRSGTVEVALHGYTHIWGRHGVHGEFHGLAYNRQLEKITKGKIFLQQIIGTKINTFVPPYNEYDLNTIKALEVTQFKCISGNRLGVGKQSSSLIILPVTCTFGLNEVRDAVQSARHIHDLKPIIVVMFHDNEFLDYDKNKGKLSFQEFDDLLSWLTSQKDIQVKSIGQAIRDRNDLSMERYMTFRSYSKLYILLPPTIRKIFRIPEGVYLSSQEALDGKKILWPLVFIMYSAISLISLCVTFFCERIFFPRSTFVSYLAIYGGIALLILLLIYEFRDEQFGPIAALGVALLIGGNIGAWLYHLRLKKKDRLKIG